MIEVKVTVALSKTFTKKNVCVCMGCVKCNDAMSHHSTSSRIITSMCQVVWFSGQASLLITIPLLIAPPGPRSKSAGFNMELGAYEEPPTFLFTIEHETLDLSTKLKAITWLTRIARRQVWRTRMAS